MLEYILLSIMIILWSFSFIVVDIAVEYISPLSIALYRFIAAGIGFLAIDLYLKYIRKKDQNDSPPDTKFSRNDWLSMLVATTIGVLIYFYSQHTAIELIGPSLPALVVCLVAPVIIAVFAIFFFDEKLNTIKIIGFSIATIGSVLLVTGGDISNIMPESPNFLGLFLALLTPLCWAIYSTITKKITETHRPFKMLKIICYIGIIELLIVVILNGDFLEFLNYFFHPVVLFCGLYLGIVVYLIGYLIWQNSIKLMKSSKASSFLYIEPFFTLLFSFLLQRNETIVFWNIMGGIIVIFAVLIINYEHKKEQIIDSHKIDN